MLTNLRDIRKSKNLTQSDLAHVCGTTAPTISRLESGERQPSFGLACRLALALGVALDSLTNESERDDNEA